MDVSSAGIQVGYESERVYAQNVGGYEAVFKFHFKLPAYQLILSTHDTSIFQNSCVIYLNTFLQTHYYYICCPVSK
jgi:hypothetical protein